MAFPSPQAWPPVIAHKIEGLHLTHPSRAIRAYTAATNEDIFSTQYAVRSNIRIGGTI